MASNDTKPAEPLAKPEEGQGAAKTADTAAKPAEGAEKAAETAPAPVEPAKPEDPAKAEQPAADPNLARIKHPEGATSCSFDGRTYEADDRGVITVPIAAVSVLASHGFELTK